jgi:integrase
MPAQIFKRQSKTKGVRWVVKFPTGNTNKDGKPTYTCKTFKLKRDAEEHRDKLKEMRRTGGAIVETSLTLSAFLDRWLASLDVRETTKASYTRLLKNHVRPTLGKRKVKTISTVAVQDLYDSLKAKGLSGRTVRLVHSALSPALKQAVAWKLLRANPCEGVVLPKPKQTETRYLTKPEQDEFMTLLREEQNKGDKDKKHRPSAFVASLFEFMLSSGCRPGEAMGLEWGSVDLKKEMVKIVQTLAPRPSKGWKLQPPKSAKSRRTIPLPTETVKMLEAHKARQAKQHLKLGSSWQDCGFVFTNEIGEPLDIGNVTKRHLKPLLKRVADELYPLKGADKATKERHEYVCKCSPYSLRHTHGTRLVEAGINVKTVSERLGHADVSTTLRVYVHSTEAMEDRAVEEIRKALY